MNAREAEIFATVDNSHSLDPTARIIMPPLEFYPHSGVLKGPSGTFQYRNAPSKTLFTLMLQPDFVVDNFTFYRGGHGDDAQSDLQARDHGKSYLNALRTGFSKVGLNPDILRNRWGNGYQFNTRGENVESEGLEIELQKPDMIPLGSGFYLPDAYELRSLEKQADLSITLRYMLDLFLEHRGVVLSLPFISEEAIGAKYDKNAGRNARTHLSFLQKKLRSINGIEMVNQLKRGYFLPLEEPTVIESGKN